MTTLDTVIIAVISAVVAFIIAWLLALGSNGLKNWRLKNRGKRFLMGKEKNVFNLDGEIINVNKFKMKDRNGDKLLIEIKPLAQQPQEQQFRQEVSRY